MSRRFSSLVLAAAFLCVAGAARAQTGQKHRRTAVLRLEFSGEVSEVGKEQLMGRLFEGLAQTGFQVFAADDLAAELYKKAPELKGCDKPECWKRIASGMQANFLVAGKVSVAQRNYEIALRLVFGGTGEVVASSTERCEICGIREASETLDLAAAALRSGLEKVEAPAQLTVESFPTGALVTVNGRPTTFTPATLELTAGVHEVRLSADGHEPVARNVEITPGKSQQLQVDMPMRPRPLSSRAWKLFGWASTIIGVAAIAAGAYALNEHGKLSNCRENPSDSSMMLCDRLNAKAMAGALLGGGGLLLGVGGLTIYASSAGAPRTGTDAAMHFPQWQVAVGGRF